MTKSHIYMLSGLKEGEYCSSNSELPCFGECARGLSCESYNYGKRQLSGLEDAKELLRERRGDFSYGWMNPYRDCQRCVKKPVIGTSIYFV